jgi:hypothetical protein
MPDEISAAQRAADQARAGRRTCLSIALWVIAIAVVVVIVGIILLIGLCKN